MALSPTRRCVVRSYKLHKIALALNCQAIAPASPPKTCWNAHGDARSNRGGPQACDIQLLEIEAE